jgi:hypothetical protein
MTDMEILQIADQCGVVAVTKHEWDGRRFNHTDDYLDGDGAALVIFAKLIAQNEREACAYWAGIALLGADRGLSNRVDQAIRARSKE